MSCCCLLHGEHVQKPGRPGFRRPKRHPLQVSFHDPYETVAAPFRRGCRDVLRCMAPLVKCTRKPLRSGRLPESKCFDCSHHSRVPFMSLGFLCVSLPAPTLSHRLECLVDEEERWVEKSHLILVRQTCANCRDIRLLDKSSFIPSPSNVPLRAYSPYTTVALPCSHFQRIRSPRRDEEHCQDKYGLDGPGRRSRDNVEAGAIATC